MKIQIVFLLILSLSVPAFSAKRGKLDIKETTAKQLISVFTEMERLSDHMFASNDQLAMTQLQSLKAAISRAIKATCEESIKAQHLNRLLMTAQDGIVAAQNTSGKQKVKILQDAYKQLVTLYESSKLNLDYKVFWCKIDRAVWLQKGTKIKNPFAPKSNCGRPTK